MTKTELLKIAKPILFNTEMVRAILDGRKTVTRRVVKPQPGIKLTTTSPLYHSLIENRNYVNFSDENGENCKTYYPKYKIGDILYVRETWSEVEITEAYAPPCYTGNFVYYKADNYGIESCGAFRGWKPSIHMPKSIARIFLKITDVRVERLQDISTRGIRAEGINECFMCCNENCETKTLDRVLCGNTWIDLWNSTIKKQDLDKYSWEANPWVWVYEFERVNEL